MLSSLYVENIAIIKKISVDFDKGLTILTGETGAGKSILIDAIGLLLGSKAKRELIGTFDDHAVVKGQFLNLPAKAMDILRENDIPFSNDEIFIERKISRDGRSTAKVNMVQVPLAFLQLLAPHLINIHGQHDNVLLLNASLHIEFLDKFACISDLIAEYREQYAKLRNLRGELQELNRQAQLRESEINRLSFKLQEYDRVSPYLGMLDHLTDRRKLLQNQKLITDFVASLHISDDISIVQFIATALSNAEKLMNFDERFKQIYTELSQLEELASSVLIQGEDIVSEFDADESLLEIEDKIYELQQLLSRYGPTEEDLLVDWEETQKSLDLIHSVDDRISAIRQEFVYQRTVVNDIAGRISKKRSAAAKKLATLVKNELSFLDMKGVEFIVEVHPIQNEKGGYKYNDRGFDRVEFLISTNIGQAPKPLSKIASGGELSRIMLSLTNVLSKQQQVGVMVFDEVDTGVSGKTAEKIGVKLREVASTCQVFCITHLAQIASLGNHHYKILKNNFGGQTITEVIKLDFEARVDEVARIIGGIDVSETVRLAAKEMILTEKK